MLERKVIGRCQGHDVLLEAGRSELLVEVVVLKNEFRHLFTKDEIDEAKARLSSFRKEARVRKSRREQFYPDDLEFG